MNRTGNDHYLLTPGPLTTSLTTKQAMLRDWGSRDPQFISLVTRIREQVTALVFGTGTHVCVPIQGSGTFAVEAALGTLVPRKGKALVLVNGSYGERMVKILKILGRKHFKLETPENLPNDPVKLDKLLSEDRSISHVAMVYCETTTGILNPVEAIASVVEHHGRSLLIDAMSAFGALPLDLRKIPCDAVMASSNKCLEGTPGIGFVVVRETVLKNAEGNCHSLALDLYEQWKGFEKNGQWRFTPPTHVLAACDQALSEHRKEGGVEGREDRYHRNCNLLVRGMRELGFETLLPDELQAPIIVTFLMPKNPKFVFEHFYDLLSRKGFIIYPGKLATVNSFRMGCIGQLYKEEIVAAVEAVREAMDEMKISIPPTPRKQSSPVTVNGKKYAWSTEPVVVVCIDGSEPDYITKAVSAGAMPYLKKIVENGGTHRLVDCVIPSFTNPNNLSIVTGVPPSVHGICGNYFYDRQAGAEVMMNDPKYLRVETILAAFGRAGAKIAVVTAKDKLRKLLGKELIEHKGICFSAEKANETTLAENGIHNALDFVGLPLPSVYSADLSQFTLAAGVKLLETYRPNLMYLSTTDYIQHKFAPGSTEANALYQMFDEYFAKLDALGAVIAITADHGMNAKTDSLGKPCVIYLQDVLDKLLDKTRVILPITDPYVVHHGALGSFATIYLPQKVDIGKIIQQLKKIPGIAWVLERTEACQRFELPEDRMGDLIVISDPHVVLGTQAVRHDLSGLDAPLRSHGGLSESKVPLILNRPTPELPQNAHLRNFSAFDVALNYVKPQRRS